MSVLLDAAAGRPLSPAAREAWLAAQQDGWADPTRLYAAGRRARRLLDGAREALAAGVGARPDELVLAPSGCASLRWAVEGARLARPAAPATVVRSAVEHSCLVRAAGEDARVVPCDRLGRVEVQAYADALTPAPVLAALIAASHEVGTRQPVVQVGAACLAAGVPLLVDAGPAVSHGRLPEVWSLLSADARAWGAPAVGLLAVRTGTRWRHPQPTPDPVDLPSVLSAALGLQDALARAARESARQRSLVDRLRERVAATVPDVEVVGDPVDRLPHVVTFSCLFVDGETLAGELDRAGFAVGSGSACSTDADREPGRPSHVLAAMGVLTEGNVRLSLHPDVSADDVEAFLTVLPGAVERARAAAGATGL